MTEGDMTVTGGKELRTLLMQSDFITSGSATTPCNEDSSIESEELDSDVEGAIYAQLYFQDGTPSNEQKGYPNHSALSSCGGISVTVLPISGGTVGETPSSQAKKSHRHKKSSGHISKKPRLDSTEAEVGRKDHAHRLPQGDLHPSSLLEDKTEEEEDSRTLAVLKKSSQGKVTFDSPSGHNAKGLHEWVEARWSGNSSSEGECTTAEHHPEEQGTEGEDCIIVGPIGEQQVSKRRRVTGGTLDLEDCVIVGPFENQQVSKRRGAMGEVLDSEDCVIVEVETPCGQQRKRKSSQVDPDTHNQILSPGVGLVLEGGEEEEEEEEDDGSCSSSSDENDHDKGSQAIGSAESDTGITSDDTSSDGDSISNGDSPATEVNDTKENQSCPGDSAASKDMWHINEKDRLGRAAYDKRNGTGRYFFGTVVCSNCKQKDHPTSECVQPKRFKVCYLCSGLHHLSSRCPDDLCQYCLGSRHRGKSCRAPWASPATICNRCYMSGHIASVCSEIWRQFHNTTDIGKMNTIKPKEQQQKRSFCYNCGASSHFGHECSQRRPQGYALPFTPIIASYDKNPHRGQIITARDNSPTPMEQDELRDTFKHKKVHKEKKDVVKPKKGKKKKKGKEKDDSGTSSKVSKPKVKFTEISPPSKKKSKRPRKLYSPPPRSRKVDNVESVSVSVNFPADSQEPSIRRVSLPALTPESSRPQWNPYAATPVENRYASVETRYSSPVESHLRRDRTASSTPMPLMGDLRRRQSAVVESVDFPRVPFVPTAARKNQSFSGEGYYADTPCTEWRSQPLISSSVPKPQPSTQEEGHATTPGLPFLRRGSQDAKPGPSSSSQKSHTPQGPSCLAQRATSAPQGSRGGGRTFTLVDGHYLSSRGFRGSEKVVRKITLLKPDLKGRRTSHQQ